MSQLLTHAGIVLAVVMGMTTALLVLQQRRTPQSAFAWLLFIIAIPYLALPVFLMLGFRKEGSRYPRMRFATGQRSSIKQHQTADMLCRLGAPPVTSGNEVSILADSSEAWQALLGLIENAQRSLDIMYYVLEDDDIGKEFVSKLEQKLQEGVRVRLILDRLGTLQRPRHALKQFVAAGGCLKFYSPFLHAPDNGHINLRNHRKLVIADNARVFTGGRNVGREYLGAASGSTPWQDLSIVISGPAIGSFEDIFRSDWAVVNKQLHYDEPAPDLPAGDKGQACVQVVPSGPDISDDILHDGLEVAIHNAKSRIWLVTPYFLPTEALHGALTIAARRGVDVRILVPEKSNQPLTDFARGAYLRELAADGCTILRYQPGMVHAKAGIIDDWCWAGSANFDVRSMLLNFELAVLFYDKPTVTALTVWFDNLAGSCETGLYKTGRVRGIAENLFKLSAPVL